MGDVSTLEQAREVRPFFDGGRLRLAREWREISQEELGERAGGVSGAAVSQFERGLAKPNSRTLALMANTLSFPVGFFTLDPAKGSLDEPAFFRSLRSTSVRQRKRARGFVEMVRRLVVCLERKLELPTLNVPTHPLTGPAQWDRSVERLAVEVRKEWGLSEDQPIKNVVLLLERNGIATTRLGFEDERVDAFSVPYSDRPIVVLCSSKDKKDRSRMDAAHELGHLVMHSALTESSKEVERQAFLFGAAFLMPEAAIGDELPSRPNWEELLRLKIKWGTSIASLLYRARTLDKMSVDNYVRAMKIMSARGWRVDEPGDLGAPESPVLLHKAVEALELQGYSIEDLAKEAALPIGELKSILHAISPSKPTIHI